MALTFGTPKVANLKVDVNLNADGNIAVDDDVVAGAKTMTIKGFKANGEVTDANMVFTKVLSGIGGASFNLNSAVRTVSQKAVNE